MTSTNALSSESSTAKVAPQAGTFVRKVKAELSLDLARSPQEVKELIIDYLDVQAAIYKRAVNFNITFAHGTIMLVIIFGLMTSVSAAVSWASQVPAAWQTIILPATCSILAALNLQFQFEKLARTRELCRIAIEELKCKAYMIPTDNMENALQGAIELLESVYQLEREQVAQTLRGRGEGSSGEGGQAA